MPTPPCLHRRGEENSASIVGGGVKDVVVKEVGGTNNQVHAVALLSDGSCGI